MNMNITLPKAKGLILSLFALFMLAGQAQVKAQCPLPGPDLEVWIPDTLETILGDTVLFEAPEGYFPLVGLITAIFGDTIRLSKSTDSHSGTYAASLDADADGAGTDLTTFFPCDQRPTSFSGYYKYDGTLTDASVIVGATKWDPAADSSETIGIGTFVFNPNSSYTQFNVAINYMSNETPDSMVVLFQYLEATTPSTRLLVDDFTLDGATAVDQLLSADEVSVSPNPAEQFLRVELENDAFAPGATLTLFDIQGRMVLNTSLESPSSTVSVEALTPGAYILSLKSNGKVFQQKILKK